jgi:hypothetical protein
MTLINFRRMVLPALLLCLAAAVSAQSGESSSPLATEIGGIESKLGLSALSAAERREAYIKLAGLHMLSGNIDVSARAWREAALADPENRDDRCLLESALCFLNLGEFDAAADALRGISGRDTEAVRDAYYIAALIEVFRSGSSGALHALLGKPEFRDYHPAICYTFWRLFGEAAYKTLILSEFPKSPEAGILQNEEAGNSAAGTRVSALNRPLWFLYPGRSNVTVGAAVPVPEVSPIRPAAVSAAAMPGALQTGLFTREQNARAMVDRLASRGFSASVSPKPVNGVTYWTVSIPAGENADQTMLALKDAGFESFLVF